MVLIAATIAISFIGTGWVSYPVRRRRWVTAICTPAVIIRRIVRRTIPGSGLPSVWVSIAYGTPVVRYCMVWCCTIMALYISTI